MIFGVNMPIITLPIPEDYETITRPLSVQIAKYILKDYAAPKGCRIVYPGDATKIAQPKSTIDDTRDKDNNYYPNDATLHIQINEEVLEDRVLATAVNNHPQENMCIFFDKKLGIYVKPVYTPVETTISFRLRMADRTKANAWRNNLKTRRSMNRAEVVHRVGYHYGLPKEFILMLVQMYKMREAVAPLNETMVNWFTRCFDARKTVATNMAGNLDTGIIVIPENQIGILGWYDFTYMPEKNEKENDAGAFAGGFDYKFQYDKVTDCVLQYPIMIHNQVLPKTMRDDKNVDNLDELSRFSQHSKHLFDFMTSQDPKWLSGIEGIAIPFFDEWLPSSTPRGVSTLFTTLMEINPLDRREMFAITDIEEIEFHPDIIPFLKGEWPYIAHIGRSIFYLNLYEGDTSTGMDKITMNENLLLRSVDELNLREINRLHFGIITDLSMLDADALDRLRAFPGALAVILATLDKYGDCGVPQPMSNGSVSLKDMKALTQCLLEKRGNLAVGYLGIPEQNINEQYRRMTGGTYTIVARKSTNENIKWGNV